MNSLPRLLAPAIVALLAPLLSADTLLVPGDAATLVEAAELAQPGDRIVLKGAQPLGGSELTGLVDIEILGKSGAFIDANEDDFALALIDCSGVTLRGVRLANSTSHGLFVSNCFDIEIERVRIDDAGFVGLLVAASSNVRIDRVRVERSSGPSVSLSESEDVQITRVKLRDSGGAGVFLFDARRVLLDRARVTDSAGHGFFAEESQELEILRSRFLRPGGSGIILEGDLLVSLLQDNVVRDSQQDGIRVEGETTLVARNRIRDVQGVGLCMSGASNSLLMSCKNRIRNTGSNGLEMLSPDQSSEGDRVVNAGGHGALLFGDGLRVTDLRVSKCALDGVHVLPAAVPFFNSPNVLSDLRVKKVDGHGLVVEQGTAAMQVSGCRVSKVAGHGMLLQDGSGTYDDNRVRSAAQNGIDVSTGNNIFRNNNVRGSKGVDLNDHPPGGQSNFFLGNDFGTGEPAPL